MGTSAHQESIPAGLSGDCGTQTEEPHDLDEHVHILYAGFPHDESDSGFGVFDLPVPVYELVVSVWNVVILVYILRPHGE